MELEKKPLAYREKSSMGTVLVEYIFEDHANPLGHHSLDHSGTSE